MSWDYYDRYSRQEDVAREIAQRRTRGEPFAAVVCEVARGLPSRTFWGRAWCENLEKYSDYKSRLPRGLSYLRKGSVYDLRITEGQVEAYVTGSEIYEVMIDFRPLKKARWQEIKAATAGQITALADLLAGRLSQEVLTLVTDREHGLFPSPREITLRCSCPDWADMCKHVAAVLYAVGVRLDDDPTLFFTLRGVDYHEAISAATDAIQAGAHLHTTDPSTGILQPDQLSELFGIDLGDPDAAL